MKNTFCILCDKPAINLCSKCKTISYCTRECQKSDWPRHKLECQELLFGKDIFQQIYFAIHNDIDSIMSSFGDITININENCEDFFKEKSYPHFAHIRTTDSSTINNTNLIKHIHFCKIIFTDINVYHYVTINKNKKADLPTKSIYFEL